MNKKLRQLVLLTAVIAPISVVGAACGSSSTSSTPAGSSTSTTASSGGSGSSSGGSGSLSAFVQSVIKQQAYSGPGGLAGATSYLKQVQDEGNINFTSFVPKTSPRIAGGKTVYVILNGSQAEGAVRAGEGATAAGKALGWTVKVEDGQLNPSVQSSAVQSAITSGASGIVLDSIDPTTIGGAVSQALAHNIPVVTAFDPGSPKEVPGIFADVSNESYGGGLALGAWLSVHSHNTAKIVDIPDTSLALTQARAAGVNAGISTFCTGCKVLTVQQNDISAMATTLPSLAASDVRRFGTDIYIVAPFDSAAQFLIQGLNDAHAISVPMVSMDGNVEALSDIRNGQSLQATWAGALEWIGWGALDELNRAFNHAPAVNETVPSLLVDKTNLPPAGKAWSPSFDYQAAYTKLWKTGS